MTPTQQEIADAARLLGYRLAKVDYDDDLMLVDSTGNYKLNPEVWQPWTDTEAGRSDWAVLDTAVWGWFRSQSLLNCPRWITEHWANMHTARDSGDLALRMTTTFATASAIGKHLRESE